MNKVLERSKRFCGYIVGIVFFLSGMSKLLDPVGTGLVMSEYYDFLNIGFMDVTSKFAGTSIALLETLTGAALITGLWRKITAVVTLTFLGVFTLLTLALLIVNPAMDCGCFGEVVHLTHLQTFLKNIGLDILACASFFPFKYLGKPKKRKYITFSVVSSTVILFTIYSLLYIPLEDFTDFKPGIRLAAAPFGTNNYAGDAYEAVFIYEKNGKQETFTLDNLPDSTWTFVSTETLRISNEPDAPVRLPIIDANGVSRDELAAGPPVIVISVYNPEAISKFKWRKTAERIAEISQTGQRSLLVVAAIPEDFYSRIDGIDDEQVRTILKDSAYFSDFKTLVSLNRSNGGATYFGGGYLIRKWAWRAFPDSDDLAAVSEADFTETYLSYSSLGSLVFQGVLLFSFAVMLLL